MTTVITLINTWKWNLEQAEIAWKEKRFDDSRRHSKNALNIDTVLSSI